MHPSKLFRNPNRQSNISFVKERSFGALVVVAEGRPLVSHIPFQLSKDGAYLEAHLVASNPILQALGSPQEATMIVSGCDAYVSPDWYNVEDQVPTWNYVAVNLFGDIRKLARSELRGVLERLSQNMEERLLPKPPWKLDKLKDQTFEKLSRQIVPIGMDIKSMEETWKLSQNKSVDARAGVVKGMRASPIGSDVAQIIELMGADLI